MAVPKTTDTRCRDRAYRHCTSNPIPTSFFHAQCPFPVISEHNHVMYKKKDVDTASKQASLLKQQIQYRSSSCELRCLDMTLRMLM